MLADAGIVTRIDRDALASYCELFTRWVDANQRIREHGIIVKGKDGIPAQSPYFRISAITFDQMKSLLVEFGMTPSSRARVKSTKDAAAENPFARLHADK